MVKEKTNFQILVCIDNVSQTITRGGNKGRHGETYAQINSN